MQQHLNQHRRPSHQQSRLSDTLPGVDATTTTRSNTPGAFSASQLHTSNIAPQHLFDQTTIDGSQSFINQSPSFSHGHLDVHRQGSPSSLINVNGNAERPLTYEELLAFNEHLKTRVSELEVINDLFRGRVAELENNETETARKLEEVMQRESDARKGAEDVERVAAAATAAAATAAAAGKHKLDIDENVVAGADSKEDDEHREKRIRTADAVAEDDTGKA